MNADENPRTSYVIAVRRRRTNYAGGCRGRKGAALRPDLAEYEKMQRQAPDTVEGQMKLAEWCRDHNLTAQRKTHLERVLQLDPNQPEARRLLGYRKVKDKWMTHDEEMTDKGYVQHIVNGETRWITPQEADNHDNVQRQLKAEAAWRKNIAIWRIWLDGNRAEQGRKNLLGIRDAAAIAPLGERLNGGRSKSIRKDPAYRRAADLRRGAGAVQYARSPRPADGVRDRRPDGRGPPLLPRRIGEAEGRSGDEVFRSPHERQARQ